jgi:hypothetical protein
VGFENENSGLRVKANNCGAYEFQQFAGTPGATNCNGQTVSALSNQYGTLDAAASALGYPSVNALQKDIKAYCAL